MDKKIVINGQIPQVTSKTEFNLEKKMNLDLNNNEYNNNFQDLNNIDDKKVTENKSIRPLSEPVEEIKFEKNNNNDLNLLKSRGKLNSLLRHEQTINPYKIKIPKDIIRSQIIPLEKELFSLLNIDYGEEIIYEDFVLVSNNEDYYVHLLRTAKLDPNKEILFLFTVSYRVLLIFYQYYRFYYKDIMYSYLILLEWD